jgi:hypothetical protein
MLIKMDKLFKISPYVFLAFFVLVVYCFFQSYFGHIPDFKNVISPIGNVPIAITKITHFHAILLVIWLLMLIVQPILIIKKKVALHRLIGKASYILMTLLVISIILIINQEQTREKDLGVFAANLVDFPVFIVLYGFAIYYRKNSAYHARFMIMSILPLFSPVLARINAPGIPIQFGLWILLFVIEFFNRKTFKPYLIGFGYYLINFAIVAYLFFANKSALERLWSLFFG